ncbi:MAG TPA: alpha-glucuronidase family glycosyl hydrolase, partial [Gammaproteobacteria bacterium]|nr:alpha-glucuronidase family glycosyl hydrolase [Gammaproteobacteria bacterium]
MMRVLAAASVLLCLPVAAPPAYAEDGYDLWLRYRPLALEHRERFVAFATGIVAPAQASVTLSAAAEELAAGASGLAARPVPVTQTVADGSLVIGTRTSSPLVAQLDLPLARLGRDGYLVRSVELDGRRVTVIAGNEDVGVLYGAFAWLRLAQTGADLAELDVASTPRIELRLLNHWDNLDGSVERGYAGASIWDWWRLPDVVDPRYTDYARANASIGINGAVLNNVNAQPEILTGPYLDKVAALARVLRPYGIRVYLSVRFSAPIDIGGLETADPLDAAVRTWWRAKADEIYARIPDFGGFLVKADSEGQPGPQGYGRTHADGANVLAAALRPYGGVVFWRAFVYSRNSPEDRVKQAYQEFVPLDGAFAENVVVQVKNGPLDFQPREPFHPLFGAMPRTPLALELQITQEYLGFATHLAYLGTLYEEVLDVDTHADGEGSTVAKVVTGRLFGYPRTSIAGVANIGATRDWTGAPFAQANWYAFGRFAWDPELSAREIAEEWLRMTFANDPKFVATALTIMLRSREAVVDYMTPLGLAHLMGTGHHYGPAPWVDDLDRAEWNPYYYHRAAENGIGLDRTASGSDALAQYAPPVADRFANLDTVPDEVLLWFHRLPWDQRLRSGQTLWEGLVAHYDRGVAEVAAMQADWVTLDPFVDAERFAKTTRLLEIQAREARWWRDACIAYFRSRSGLPLPSGVA